MYFAVEKASSLAAVAMQDVSHFKAASVQLVLMLLNN